MKLISNLDFNGNKILNVDKTGSSYAINLPTSAGTLARIEDITAQHAFVFKGNATSYEHKGDNQADVLWFDADQKAAAILAGVRSQDFNPEPGDEPSLWSLASDANGGEYNGFVFQVNDKEFASNGDVQWVELGLNIDLSNLVTEAEWTERIANYYTKTETDNKFETQTHAAETYATIATVEENEEVVAAALNDHESRLEAVEGDSIEKIYLEGSQTALTVTNNAVTLPNAVATDVEQSIAGQNGLMSLADKNKLDDIAAGAQVNVLEGVQMAGTDLTITSKKVNIPLADGTSGSETNGLMAVADKQKLDGIEASADVNILEGVQLNGTDLTITDKKVNIVNATPSTSGEGGTAGLMSAPDKEKLNGIEAGAEVNDIIGIKLTGDSAALPIDSTTRLTTIPEAIATQQGVTEGHNGLMSLADKNKLDQVNLNSLAVTYFTKVTSVASGTHSVTIAKSTHGCGDFPMVQVYRDYDVVNADIRVASNAKGDVTISWEEGADPTSEHPIRIRIIGNALFTDPA